MKFFSVIFLLFSSLYSIEIEKITIKPENNISIPKLNSSVLKHHTFFTTDETLKAFKIAKYELSIREYIFFLKSTNQKEKLNTILYSDVEINEPVTNVDFDEAQSTCEFYGARLPTELEWVVAASIKLSPSECYKHIIANSFSAFSIENFPLDRDSNVSACILRSDDEFEADLVGSELVDVDMSIENINGTFGMFANVWEWVDNKKKNFNDEYRVIKGGSFANYMTPELFDSRVTNFLKLHTKMQNVGFRCAWDIKTDKKRSR